MSDFSKKKHFKSECLRKPVTIWHRRWSDLSESADFSICCRGQRVKHVLKFSAQSDKFLNHSARHKIEFFRKFFFSTILPFFQKNSFFYFDTKKFRLVAFLGLKILSFCYRIQNFRIFQRVDEPHGLISEQAVRTFSTKVSKMSIRRVWCPNNGTGSNFYHR